MKRTRQTFHYAAENMLSSNGVSGCRLFEGEDRQFYDRTKANASQQKEWIKEQLKEKKQNLKAEQNEENAYAIQTLELNRMRGMLEDEMTLKRQEMEKKIKAENKRLALEKRMREQRWKEEQERLNQYEVNVPTQNITWAGATGYTSRE